MPYLAGRAVAVALTATVMGSRSSAVTPDADAIAEQVLAQVDRMPDFLLPPVRLLTGLFDWSAVLWTGRRFHRLSTSERQRHLERWRGARLAPCRDFVRLFESLIILCWFRTA